MARKPSSTAGAPQPKQKKAPAPKVKKRRSGANDDEVQENEDDVRDDLTLAGNELRDRLNKHLALAHGVELIVPCEYIRPARENPRSLESAAEEQGGTTWHSLSEGINGMLTRYKNIYFRDPATVTNPERKARLEEEIREQAQRRDFLPELHPCDAYLAVEDSDNSDVATRLSRVLEMVASAREKNPDVNQIALTRRQLELVSVKAVPVKPVEGIPEDLSPPAAVVFARVLAGQGRLEVSKRMHVEAGKPKEKPPFIVIKLFKPTILEDAAALAYKVSTTNAEDIGRVITPVDCFNSLYAYDAWKQEQQPAKTKNHVVQQGNILIKAHPSLAGQITSLKALRPSREFRQALREYMGQSGRATSAIISNVSALQRSVSGGGALETAVSYVKSATWYASDLEGGFERSKMLVSMGTSKDIIKPVGYDEIDILVTTTLTCKVNDPVSANSQVVRPKNVFSDNATWLVATSPAFASRRSTSEVAAKAGKALQHSEEQQDLLIRSFADLAPMLPNGRVDQVVDYEVKHPGPSPKKPAVLQDGSTATPEERSVAAREFQNAKLGHRRALAELLDFQRMRGWGYFVDVPETDLKRWAQEKAKAKKGQLPVPEKPDAQLLWQPPSLFNAHLLFAASFIWARDAILYKFVAIHGTKDGAPDPTSASSSTQASLQEQFVQSMDVDEAFVRTLFQHVFPPPPDIMLHSLRREEMTSRDLGGRPSKKNNRLRKQLFDENYQKHPFFVVLARMIGPDITAPQNHKRWFTSSPATRSKTGTSKAKPKSAEKVTDSEEDSDDSEEEEDEEEEPAAGGDQGVSGVMAKKAAKNFILDEADVRGRHRSPDELDGSQRSDVDQKTGNVVGLINDSSPRKIRTTASQVLQVLVLSDDSDVEVEEPPPLSQDWSKDKLRSDIGVLVASMLGGDFRPEFKDSLVALVEKEVDQEGVKIDPRAVCRRLVNAAKTVYERMMEVKAERDDTPASSHEPPSATAESSTAGDASAAAGSSTIELAPMQLDSAAAPAGMSASTSDVDPARPSAPPPPDRRASSSTAGAATARPTAAKAPTTGSLGLPYDSSDEDEEIIVQPVKTAAKGKAKADTQRKSERQQKRMRSPAISDSSDDDPPAKKKGLGAFQRAALSTKAKSAAQENEEQMNSLSAMAELARQRKVGKKQ
ncbi:hypothetical protein JCM5296_003630 [Sporobolomyces johnsonii]